MFIVDNLWSEIILSLHIRNISSLISVSKYFSYFRNNEYLWKRLCERDHEYLPPKKETMTWRELYMIQYKRKIFLSKRAQEFNVVINPDEYDNQEMSRVKEDGGKCFVFHDKNVKREYEEIRDYLLTHFDMKIMKKGDYIRNIQFRYMTTAYLVFDGNTLRLINNINWDDMGVEFSDQYWSRMNMYMYSDLSPFSDQLIENSKLYFCKDHFKNTKELEKLDYVKITDKKEIEKFLVNRTQFPVIRSYFVKEDFTYFVYVFFIDNNKDFNLSEVDYKEIFEDKGFHSDGYSSSIRTEKNRSYYHNIKGFVSSVNKHIFS